MPRKTFPNRLSFWSAFFLLLFFANFLIARPSFSLPLDEQRDLLDDQISRWDKLRDEQDALEKEMPDFEEKNGAEKDDVDKWLDLCARLDELQAQLDATTLDIKLTLSGLSNSKEFAPNKKHKEIKASHTLVGIKRNASLLKELGSSYVAKALIGQVEAIEGQMKARYWLRANRMQTLGTKLIDFGQPRLSLQAHLALGKIAPCVNGYLRDFDPSTIPLDVGISYLYSGEIKRAQELAELEAPAKIENPNLFNGKKALLQALIAEQVGDYAKGIEQAKICDKANLVFRFPSAFCYTLMARCYVKNNQIVEALTAVQSARNMSQFLIDDAVPRAEIEIAEVEYLLGDYDAALPRLEKIPDSFSNLYRYYGAKQSLIKALIKTKQKKLSEAETDLSRCKGWLEELPTLEPLAKSASTALSDACGTRFPLTTPVREKFALLVGVGKFKDPSIPKLKYSAKDASDMKDMLVQNYGFKPENVKLLTDAQATKQALNDALRDNWLPQTAKPEDLILVFVSSHGTPSCKDVASRNYVVLHDTDKKNLFSTSLAMEQICKMLRSRCKAKKVLVIADTCYSGGLALEGDNQVNLNPDEFVVANSMLVLSSSNVNQKSWESRRYENSVFTRQLIESFKKNRHYSNFNQVFNELQNKTATEVKEDDKADQIPRLGGIWNASELAN